MLQRPQGAARQVGRGKRRRKGDQRMDGKEFFIGKKRGMEEFFIGKKRRIEWGVGGQLRTTSGK